VVSNYRKVISDKSRFQRCHCIFQSAKLLFISRFPNISVVLDTDRYKLILGKNIKMDSKYSEK